MWSLPHCRSGGARIDNHPIRSTAVTAVHPVHETVNAVYVAESRRVLATLIRLLGDFEAAEEALHDAFRAALEQWPRDGVPANPRAWLVSAGRVQAEGGEAGGGPVGPPPHATAPPADAGARGAPAGAPGG